LIQSDPIGTHLHKCVGQCAQIETHRLLHATVIRRDGCWRTKWHPRTSRSVEDLEIHKFTPYQISSKNGQTNHAWENTHWVLKLHSHLAGHHRWTSTRSDLYWTHETSSCHGCRLENAHDRRMNSESTATVLRVDPLVVRHVKFLGMRLLDHQCHFGRQKPNRLEKWVTHPSAMNV
jgi:hypothetical protein